jgi:hypothetical protein
LMVRDGAALVENTDIVVEPVWLVELEPLYHGPVDSVTVVRVDSLVSRACFVPGAREVWFCHGPGRMLFLGVRWSTAVTGSGDETSGVAAGRSTEGLLNYISTWHPHTYVAACCATGPNTYLDSLWAELAGVKGAVDVEGNS